MDYTDKIKRQLKEYGHDRLVVYFLSRRHIPSSKMTKRNKDIHKEVQNESSGDEIITFLSIKVIHGICKTDKLFHDKKKIFCKTPDKSVIE